MPRAYFYAAFIVPVIAVGIILLTNIAITTLVHHQLAASVQSQNGVSDEDE